MINELKERLEEFKETSTNNEENLKSKVISWVLSELGYEAKYFDYEHPLCRRKGNDRRADIYIPIARDSADALFVETKKLDKELNESDIQQLLGYMYDKQLRWGILTNGKEYYLLNNMIMPLKASGDMSAVFDRVVLHVDIYKPKNVKYFKYFQKNNIFDNGSTRFFRDIAQFFAYQNYEDGSRGKYENTLYGFFDEYIGKGHFYNNVPENIHRPLEDVRQSDFIEYLLSERPAGRPYEGGVPLSKVSHISVMYKVLNDNGYISRNDFANLRTYVKSYFDREAKEKDYTVLSDENIKICINGLLNNKGKNKWVKIIIFTMCTYYGFNLRTIKEFFDLSWDAIDLVNGTFAFYEKQYMMPQILIETLKEMEREYKRKKVKTKTLYINKSGSSKLSSDTISEVFKECCNILNENKRNVEQFTTTIICPAVYNRMFCAGYSLEEIAAYCNTSVSALLQYIPESEIEKMGRQKLKKNGNKRKHPLDDAFCKNDESSKKF